MLVNINRNTRQIMLNISDVLCKPVLALRPLCACARPTIHFFFLLCLLQELLLAWSFSSLCWKGKVNIRFFSIKLYVSKTSDSFTLMTTCLLTRSMCVMQLSLFLRVFLCPVNIV